MNLDQFITAALIEDIGPGDFTSLSTIPDSKVSKAKLLVKESGIIAGIELAKKIFNHQNKDLKFNQLISDGNKVSSGDIAFYIEGFARDILQTERLVLNCMQRMSGIATVTRKYVEEIKGTKAKILDTRKTTPLMRQLEKEAVVIGGGFNHRFALYDMILIKDNHVDAAGGIHQAIISASGYNKTHNLNLKIEIETRDFDELNQVLNCDIKVDRIMLDNFSPSDLKKAIEIINGNFETEASGGITLDTIRLYADSGVNYISVGALTHSVKSLDLSLKIIN